MSDTNTKKLRGWGVAMGILCIAVALVFLLSSSWTSWGANNEEQKTDDAYVRADVTPLSTKAAGLVASVEVTDYQSVKAGDLLVRLRDEDFKAQVAQAEAAAMAGETALVGNQRQKELQDARIQQAQTGILAAEAEISAAEAGIQAANSALANTQSGLRATEADVLRTSLERKRQEALVAAESATRQRLEQATAEEERFRAQQASRQAEIDSARAQLASRQADLSRARAHVESSRAELETQRRQHAVLDSQEQTLRADLKARQASLELARTNLGYTRIVAPQDGIVGERKVRSGQLVSPGTQIVSLVGHPIWVQANYRETQLRHIRKGDPAEIRVDEFPELSLKGRVAEIAPASGSQFALLPPDNATGNFTKVAQRVPVKIVLDEGQAGVEELRPGLSVVAAIRTKGAAEVSQAPVTTRPYIGILGVFLGAATATLNGRLVSIGLPDLRGAFGLGFDDASWIPTVLNMGTMFIGVFAVFLGAAYGIRRVLMVAAALFTVVSFLLPFSGNLAAMLALQALAGMSSGAFYTLTLTFVVRNLPKKLLLFGVAAYAMDIVVTSNVAALIEGWYMGHLSWHWIFWTAAVLTPIMMVCIHFGIPPADEGPRPSWRGFLYVSAGLSLLYGALDQGQRLDWWRSGVFVGMLAGAFALLLAAFVRRYFQPNPLVNLPFLNARNLVILGLGVFTIRFALLAPLSAIPGFLGAIQQYVPIQTGAVLAWVAAPQFVLVWIAAISTAFIQPRLVMAAGFATVGIACWMAAHLDSSWAGGSFLIPELMLASGIAAAFVGLVVNLLLLAVEMGATTNVANTATYSAWMHTMRLMGGEIGAVTFGHFLAVREQLHSNQLGQNIDAGNWITEERLRGVALSLAPFSAGWEEAQARSAAILGAQVRAQAFSMAYADAFMLIAWAIAGYLTLLIFLRPSTISLRPQEKEH